MAEEVELNEFIMSHTRGNVFIQYSNMFSTIMSWMLMVQAEGMKDLVADVSNQTLRPNQNGLFTPHAADIRRTPLEQEKENLSEETFSDIAKWDEPMYK